MHPRSQLSIPLSAIRNQRDLVQCYIDTRRERDNAITDPEFRPVLTHFDHKLARLTRWLLTCFEATPTITCVFVPSRDVMLKPGNGEILMLPGNGVFDLEMCPCPEDPEDRPSRIFAADAVADFQFMDDDMEVDSATERCVA